MSNLSDENKIIEERPDTTPTNTTLNDTTMVEPDISEATQNDSADDNSPKSGELSADILPIIGKTAVKTLYWLIVSVMLILACLNNFFPYNAMRIYGDLGMNERSYEMALKALDRERANKDTDNSRYLALLVECANLSITLTDKQTKDIKFDNVKWDLAQYYAQNTILHIKEFLSADGASARIDKINFYNLSSSNPIAHAGLYDYRAYLNQMLFRAEVYTDFSSACESLIGRVNSFNAPLASIVTTYEQFVTVIEENSGRRKDELLSLYIDCSTLLSYDLYRMDYTSESDKDNTKPLAIKNDPISFGVFYNYERAGGYTDFFNQMKKYFPYMKKYVVNYEIKIDGKISQAKMLEQLYYFRGVISIRDKIFSMANNLKKMQSSLINDNGQQEAVSDEFLLWRGINNDTEIKQEGESAGYSRILSEYYYNTLLPKYVISFR